MSKPPSFREMFLFLLAGTTTCQGQMQPSMPKEKRQKGISVQAKQWRQEETTACNPCSFWQT